MVRLRCQHLQSGVNQQVLQQWKALLKSAQCPSVRPSFTRQQDSSLFTQRMSLSTAMKELEATTAALEQEKRQLRKRIPTRIASHIDQHARSPVALSVHTHATRKEFKEAWELMHQITQNHQPLPYSTAHLLLEALRQEIHMQQTKLNGHNSKLQTMYLHRLEQLLLNIQRQSGVSWESSDLGVIFDLFGRLDRVERAEVVFRNWQQYTKHDLTTDSINKMLSMYFRRLKYSDTSKQLKYITKMQSLYASMPRRGCMPDATTYNWILAAKIKVNDFEGAEKWYNKLPTVTADRTTYHLMLQGALKNGNNCFDIAEGWMDRMIQAGLSPNRNTFKHVLSGLSQQVSYFSRMNDVDEMNRVSASVKRLFGVMHKLKHKPDTAVLNTLLKCFIITNDHDEIKHILKKLNMPLQQTGGGCSGCSCQSSTSPSSPSNITTKKKERWSSKKLVCEPDLFTFNSLIHYELKNDQLEKGLRWYDDMIRMNIQPDTVTYGTFIGYYINKGNIREALQYYDVMERKDIPGNVVIYNMLLKGAQAQPTIEKDIIERHRRLLMNMVNQNTVSYNTRLASSIADFSKHSDGPATVAASQRFADVYEQMLVNEVIPNERTYNIALDIYGKLSKNHPLDSTINDIMTSMAGYQLKAASSSSFQPDVITYALNIRNAIYQHNLPLAESFLQTMVDCNVKPNAHIFSHLMVGYVQDGNYPKAHELLTIMKQAPYHVQATCHVYTPLIQGYAENGDFDRAYELFKSMLEQGVQPDITTYTVLADMFVVHGSPKEAIRLLSGLKDRGDQHTGLPNVELDCMALGLLMEAHGLAGQSVSNNLATSSLSPTLPASSSSSASWVSSPVAAATTTSATVSDSPHFDAVQDIYAKVGSSNSIINAIYLTALARLQKPRQAWEAWEAMEDRSTIHYNSLLMGLTEHHVWYSKAKEVFDTMTAAPDGITFDSMINAATMNGDLSYICTHLWPSQRRPKPRTSAISTENTSINNNQTHPPPIYMLVRTYYKVLKAMLSCQDHEQAQLVYQESLALTNIPASATLWRKEIHVLALANGLLDKKPSSPPSSRPFVAL